MDYDEIPDCVRHTWLVTGTGTSAGILQGAAVRNALHFGRHPELWSPQRDTPRTGPERDRRTPQCDGRRDCRHPWEL